MDELEGWVRQNADDIGVGETSLGSLTFSLIRNAESDSDESELMAWLHSSLELEFGRDIYYESQYIDPHQITDDCRQYRALIEEYSGRGDSYRQAVRGYQDSLEICERLRATDVVIVLNAVELSYGQFNTRDRNISGQILARVEFIQTDADRRMASPVPMSITQNGYGENATAAMTELRNKLFAASTKFIDSQFMSSIISTQNAGRLTGNTDSYSYLVIASGIDTDSSEGREILRSTRNWFRNNYNLELEVDYSNPLFGEVAHRFTTSEPVNWTAIQDRLYEHYEASEVPVRIDVDVDSNLTVAFIDDSAAADSNIVAQITDSSIRRNIRVEETNMIVRRRDPDTGIAITINEANVTIRNRSRRDLLIAVDPVWTNADGAVEEFPFSNMKYVLVGARSTGSFTFRAPNRFSQGLSLEIGCPPTGCRID
jgi:hypothetical protein